MTDATEATGVIFDLQRFTLNDGPGIRTTVFLKGCPLRCVWCHNPESQSPEPELSFNEERCTGCGACAGACPAGAHRIEAGDHCVERRRCTLCGRCVAACPNEALAIIGRTATADDVLREVERDRAYYERSGGGMTVSGGEPMAQFAFLTALLRGAGERGLSTCLDTSGLAPRERYEAVLNLVDVFLFDYKATDTDRHRELTGHGNELILANLETLCAAGARVILRCPLAPGLNDSDDHLAAIAALCRRHPQIEAVEVMAYHEMGRGKATRLGWAAGIAPTPLPGPDQQDRWLARLRELGCRRARLG